MKKKNVIQKNYLEQIPKRTDIRYTEDKDGIVTLEIENKGIANRIAQKLLNKPKITYIHLDKFGSFVWLKIDGKMSVIDLGRIVEDKFGDEVSPLYERLAKYLQILYSYGFILWA